MKKTLPPTSQITVGGKVGIRTRAAGCLRNGSSGYESPNRRRIRRRPNADATETPSRSARLFASLFSTLATLTDKPFVFFFDGRHAVVFAQQAGKKKREVATLASESGAADSSLRQHFRVGGGPRKRHLPPTLADKARSGADTRAVNHRESGAVADFFPQPQRPVRVHSRSNDKGAATSCVSTPAPDLTG